MHFKQFPLKVNRYNSCCLFLSERSPAILKYLKTCDSGKPNDWRHMNVTSCNEEVDSLLPKSKCVRERKYGLCKKNVSALYICSEYRENNAGMKNWYRTETPTRKSFVIPSHLRAVNTDALMKHKASF